MAFLEISHSEMGLQFGSNIHFDSSRITMYIECDFSVIILCRDKVHEIKHCKQQDCWIAVVSTDEGKINLLNGWLAGLNMSPYCVSCVGIYN